MVDKENIFLDQFRLQPSEKKRGYFVTVYRNQRGIKEDCYDIMHQENCKLFLIDEEEFIQILNSRLFDVVNERCGLLIDQFESESLRPEYVLVCDEIYHSLNLPEEGQMAKALEEAKNYGYGLSFDF